MAASLVASQRRARDGEADMLSSANDPEQRKKFQEICDLLLAAGYFRVRIQGLGEFDKVIGGLAWAITASNVDVEVDVFFQEEARLGEQIKIGETILKALARMKCPHPLQPQQIRGLDFIHIFPVIQWLVAKVYETREITGDLIRRYSESQYSQTMKLPQDAAFEARKDAACGYVSSILEQYGPRRFLKAPSTVQVKTQEDRVQVTLLEYGNQYKASRAALVDDKKAKLQRSQSQYGKAQEDAEKLAKQAAAEEARLQGLMGTYNVVTERPATGAVAEMMNAERGNIQQAVSLYGTGLGETRGRTPAEQRQFLEERFKRAEEHKKRQLATATERVEQLRGEYAKIAQGLQALQAQLQKAEKFNARIQKEIDKMNALETPENAGDIRRLRTLVAENEILTSQEEQFKASCRAQKASWDTKIAALARNEPTDDDRERKRQVEEAYTEDEARLKEARLLAAKRNRDLVAIERKIDDIPSRSELQQYQRAFAELYEQVAAQLTETRKYFNTYNMCSEEKGFFAKEVSLLGSIQDNFKAALSTEANRAKFIASLENILAGVAANLDKKSAALAQEKKQVDEASARHVELVEKERAYYRAAKEFEDECRKNEALSSKLPSS